MCVDCVLASPRIAQVDPRDEPLSEVVLSHGVTTRGRSYLGKRRRVEVIVFKKKFRSVQISGTRFNLSGVGLQHPDFHKAIRL
jgi:hypothetical protein